MEQSNKIQRSETWNRIHNIVKQIPRMHTVGDALDAPSAATEIEQLFDDHSSYLREELIKYSKWLQANNYEPNTEDCINAYIESGRTITNQ